MQKSLFLFFVFVSIETTGFSQSAYHKLLDKDTTSWQHFDCFIPVGQYEKNNSLSIYDPSIPYVAIDTITFNSKFYKKIYSLNNFGLNYSGKLLNGFMREDTIAKKIYFTENASSPEYLLYDFSLAVNDSVLLTFPNGGSTGYYRCDSIVVKNEVSGPRRHFFLRKHTNNSQPNLFYLEHIEGIGSNFQILYIYFYPNFTQGGQFAYSSGNCKYPWEIGLACKQNKTKKQFQSCTFVLAQQNTCLSPVDSCDYRNKCSGLKNNDWDRIVKIGPNPSNDKIEVSIGENFEKINCSVTDLAGKIIFSLPKSSMQTERNSFSFSTKDLATGVYVVQVDLNGTLVRRPIVIQN